MEMYQYSDLSSITADKLDRDYKAIENSIKNILLTPIGSMPGKPLFGSNISSFLFSNIDDYLLMTIRLEVERSINNWEKRAILMDVVVEAIEEYNRVIVKIYFTIEKDPRKQIYDVAIKVK